MPYTEHPIWDAILDHVRFYPSPHNSQPIKIQFINATTADVFYDLDLGLPAESYGIPFAHVCAGVFLESLTIVAAAEGFTTAETLYYDELDFTSPERLHLFARITLEPRQPSEADHQRFEAYVKRQTSRRPYDNKFVDSSIIAKAEDIAREHGYVFNTTNEESAVRSIIRVNQATLFDDLRNDDVYKEIMNWLRFSRQEAATKKDGLSAETMLMPGKLLHFVMKHRNIWTYPVIGAIIRHIYLNTMKGVRQLGWLEGPFHQPKDYIEAGRTFMQIWIHFTQHDVYLHPFGTVITSPRSHKRFTEHLKIKENEQSMAWMLFRFGYSQQPPKAHRRSAESMIIKKENHG